MTYLAYDEDKLEKLLEDPKLLRTPIVRNGRQATVGYQRRLEELGMNGFHQNNTGRVLHPAHDCGILFLSEK